MDNRKLKFVFFGTGDFAVKILDILHKNNFVPELIITTPDKPKGRKMILTPPPVKSCVMEHKTWSIKILQPENLITNYKLLITNYYDLFIVADYGKIIPKEILEIPKHGALNVHPSLLPKFRGPSPIQSFILSGVPTQNRDAQNSDSDKLGKNFGKKETGVTIILMDEEIDHGPIVAISNLKNQISNLNYRKLEKKLAELGGKLLVKIIPEWISGKIKPQAQDDSKATFTKKITKDDGFIDINKDSPTAIHKKVLALTPWPSAYFFIEKDSRKIRIIITEAELRNGQLVIKSIKPEGKNEMPLKDFFRGNKALENQIKKLTKPHTK